MDVKIEEPVNSGRTKIVLEFNCQDAASIKSFAVKQSYHVNLTTKFLSRKILMFVKLSLMSFKYEMLETVSFPDKKVCGILKKYKIEKVHICHVLNDTGSTCFKFMFVSDLSSGILERKYRDIILEVIIASEICNRFDSSLEYWQNINVRRESLRKCL